MLNKFKIQKLSFLKYRTDLHKVITNTGWLFADRILRMGVGLILGIWVARYLGVQQYGLLSYAISFVTVFSPFATLGLDHIVVRDIVAQSSEKDKILGSTLWLKFLGGLFSLFLLVIFIFVFRQGEYLTILIVAILGTGQIFKAFDTIDFWFQSQVQSKYTVIAKNTAFIITTLIKVVLIKMKAPLIAFAVAILLETILGGICLVIAYRIRGYFLHLWRWNFPIAKTLLKNSWPLILSGLMIVINMKIDQIMLGEMINNSAVGIYSAASRISEAWYFIPTAILSSVSPSIFAAKQSSETLYYQRLQKLVRFMALISIVITLPMSFLSDSIIILLFGKGYAAAGQILSIHIWASLFIFVGVAVTPWFIAEGFTHLALRRNLIGAIINVLLNLFLIPKYAGTGAAIATVISYAIGSVFANATHPKTQKIFKIQIKSIFMKNIKINEKS